MYNFSITDKQNSKIAQWCDDQNAKAIERQKENPPRNIPMSMLESSWEKGYPYGGAIGGDLTYSFTPTNIGVVVKITHGLTNETLDISDYDNW